MYHICRIEGFIRAAIDNKGKPNKYGAPKNFETKEDEEKWITKHTYKGMSWRYEIYKED